MSNLETHEAEQEELTADFERAVLEGRACPHCARHRDTLEHGGCGRDDCVSRWFPRLTNRTGFNGPVLVEGLIKARVAAGWGADRTNSDRADEAFALVQAMEVMTGVDELGTGIQDAMTHLMHLARMAKAPLDAILENAKMNFDAEVRKDQDWRPGAPHP